MDIHLSGSRVKRYKDLAYLLIKYSRTGITSNGNIEESFMSEEMKKSETYKDKPEKLVNDLQELGPTFIKFGQMLSTRHDLLPAPYIDSLAKLQDEVEPFEFEKVKQIISDEIGADISHLFEEFDETPLSAASLGQVHKAKLKSGREVAVKIQRPGIRKQITDDLEAFDSIASTIDKYTETGKKYSFQEILAEFKSTLLNELDYRKESQNLKNISKNLSEFKNIIVPEPIDDYTTDKVLTMTFISGSKISKISNVVKTEFEGSALARELFESYLRQILVNGFFHADPHPGNILLTEDKKLGLLDLGMVSYLDDDLRENILKILLAISKGDGRMAAEINFKMGIPLDEINKEKYVRESADVVAKFKMLSVEELNFGRIIYDIVRISAENGLRTNPEFTMIGKTLMNLDEIARLLEPDIEPLEIIRENIESIMTSHMLHSLSPGNIFSSALEINEFIQNLPRRLNSLLEKLDKNEMLIKMKYYDESDIRGSLHRLANRITLGLIIASLIIGGAMVMNIETETFTIFGYPGLAMIIFFLAVIFGFGLVVSIFFGNKKNR